MSWRRSSLATSILILRSRALHDILYSIEDTVRYLYIREAQIYTLYAHSSRQLERVHEILIEAAAVPPFSRDVCADIIDRAQMLAEETRETMRQLVFELGDILIGRRTLEQVVCYREDDCELD